MKDLEAPERPGVSQIDQDRVTLLAREAGKSWPVAVVAAVLRLVSRRSGRDVAVAVEHVTQRKRSIPPVLLSYFLLAALPAAAASVYLFFFAADRYVAETRFAVRAVNLEPESPDGEIKSTGGTFSFTSANQNSYIVTSFIRSRAAVDDVNASLDLRQIYRAPQADFWTRLKKDASVDELSEYWLNNVSTFVDSLSGIVTVKTQAYTPEDAMAIANAIVAASERLVNVISERARRDATAMSEKSVREAYAAVQTALRDLHEFRNTYKIIDPGQTGVEIGKVLAPLIVEKIKIESDLAVASREMGANAPAVRILKNKLEVVSQQIADLKGKLTGGGGGDPTVAASLAKFEELEIQRLLAERMYALAQADLNRAQIRASRQNVYLSVFVPPALPADSLYPRRIAYSIFILVALSIIWSIGAMIYASVEDHRL
jgi:capsular polysaccharide transport system permease protein